MQPNQQDRHAPPASPCINVCVLGAGGECLGCLRTGDEIARWRDMSVAEQWRLIDELAARLARRVKAGGGPPQDGPASDEPPPDGSANEV